MDFYKRCEVFIALMNQIQEIGFLLTRHCRDTKNGIETCYWVKTPNGPLKLVVDKQQALFFIAQNDIDRAKALLESESISISVIKPLNLSTFKSTSVAGVYFDKLSEFYRARAPWYCPTRPTYHSCAPRALPKPRRPVHCRSHPPPTRPPHAGSWPYLRPAARPRRCAASWWNRRAGA